MYYIKDFHPQQGLLLLTRCEKWATVEAYSPNAIHPYDYWPYRGVRTSLDFDQVAWIERHHPKGYRGGKR